LIGSGKSSLLNVLAGRSASTTGIKIEGCVKVAGQEINPVSFRKNIAYVMQDDALMATAHLREALEFRYCNYYYYYNYYYNYYYKYYYNDYYYYYYYYNYYYN